MSNIKKLMVSAAGGGGLDVDEVFSTYLYDGNSGAQTFVNGLDLAGEGGLVWSKRRNGSAEHILVDSERNVGSTAKVLSSSNNLYELSEGWNWSFNSDGYSLNTTSAEINDTPSREYCSWSFRKAPKFFDIVTWTGNGVNGRSISHSLNSLVGMITIKCTSTGSTNWSTWHRGANGTLWLNSTNPDSANGGGQATSGFVYNPGSNTSAFSVDNGANVNQSGRTYVAYLFAHNNGDGGFGPDGDQDIIKCGSWTASSTSAVSVNLGFEPQWVLIKRATGTQDWLLWDTMRGMPVDTVQPYLSPSSSSAEGKDTYYLSPTATGFTVRQNALGSNGDTYIYMAIRRGPLAVPDDATKVFTPALGVNGVNQPAWNSGFPVDMAIDSNIGGGSTDDRTIGSRLTQGRYLDLNSTHQEYAWSDMSFDYMDGYREGNNGSSDMAWMWRRAPGYFDVVAYSGTGTTNQTLNHNLGVAPEMMWVKRRNGGSSWLVYHKGLDVNGDGAPETDVLDLTAADAAFDYKNGWWDTAPTDTQFTVGAYNNVTNNGNTYIAYLFASAPGVSKVGSYTGNGSSQTINCGFTSGARFVLIKRTDSTGSWYVWDTVRGINAGNETGLKWNDTDAEFGDFIDPANSGFTIVQDAAINNNVSGSTYIFYAIA